MFSWIKKVLLGGDGRIAETPRIAAGELWQFVSEPDPWGAKHYPPVRILDVRGGWVRYDMGGRLFRDERQRVDTFVSMYRRVDARAAD